MIGQTIGRRATRLVLTAAFVLTMALGIGLVHRPHEAAAQYGDEVACTNLEEAYWEMFAAAEAAHNRGDQKWFDVYYNLARGIQASARQMGCF
jgi:hypothetical protein